MEKWKKALILCVVFFIVGILIENIWASNDLIWNIGKAIIIISIVVGILTLILGVYLTYKETKKENKKMPIWFSIVMAIVITFVIIFVLGNYFSNKMEETYNEQYNHYNESNDGGISPSLTPPSSNSLNKNTDIKDFNEVANEYNITSDELEQNIEEGIAP